MASVAFVWIASVLGVFLSVREFAHFCRSHSKQKSYKIMKTKMFAIFDKAKPDTGNTTGLNLAAVMFTTVQVSRLPLSRELLVSSRP
jgi:hypothetical protein